MLPQEKVQYLINRHLELEKELSSGQVNKKKFAEISKEYSDLNEIIVGSKKELIKKEIILKDINLLSDKKIFDNEIFVKVRSTGRLLKSKLNLENGKAKLNLLEDEYGISPGQACVFYSKDKNGDKVLGGGWITKN